MAHFETVMNVRQEFWTADGKQHWVSEIRVDEDNVIYYVYDFHYDDCYSSFTEEDIGKTVFLSEEDAKLVLDKNIR